MKTGRKTQQKNQPKRTRPIRTRKGENKEMKDVKVKGNEVKVYQPNPKAQDKTHKRIPRPLGLTILMREGKGGDKNKLRKAKNMLIQEWQRNDFTFNGERLDINKMAYRLNMSPLLVIEEMTKAVRFMVGQGKAQEISVGMAAAAHQFFGQLQARYLNHLEAIEGRLGGKNGELSYKPFVTEAALKTLDGLLNTGKSQFEVAKFFQPKAPTIVNQQANFGQNPEDPKASTSGKYLGPTEAVRLLEAEGRANILDNEALAGRSLTEHASPKANLPEIIATKQQGIDMNGIDIAKPKKVKRNHTDRREDDGYILPEVIIP
jgi:hypothetical protein